LGLKEAVALGSRNDDVTNARQRVNQTTFDESPDRRDRNGHVVRGLRQLERSALSKRNIVFAAMPLRRRSSRFFRFASNELAHAPSNTLS
jgi:hypothetical protein